ncbi:MAG: hypothetical protein ACK5S9_11915, partial [Roseiflexaceae bacterium]
TDDHNMHIHQLLFAGIRTAACPNYCSAIAAQTMCFLSRITSDYHLRMPLYVDKSLRFHTKYGMIPDG